MELSNKTLAILLILGMAVSLFGTLNVLHKLSLPTGFATTDTKTGLVKYNISSNVMINFTTATIDFREGYVATGHTNCTMDSQGNKENDACVGFNPPSTGLVLENIGNKNANVSISFSKNATGFMNEYSLFKFKTNEYTEAGSCNSGLNYNNSWENIVQDTNYTICDNLSFETSSNDLEIDVNITLDYRVNTNGNVTVTAYASELV